MKKSVLTLLVASFFLPGCAQGQKEAVSSGTDTTSSPFISSATSADGSSSSSAAASSSSSKSSSSSVDTVYTLWPDQYTIPASAPMTFGDYVVGFSGFSSTTIQPFDDQGNAKSAVSVFALAPNGWVGYGAQHGTQKLNLPKCTSFNYTMLDVASDADDLPGLNCAYGPSADQASIYATNPQTVRAVKDLDATHKNVRVISGTVTFQEATSFFDLENVFLLHADGTHESTPTLDAYFLDLTVEFAVS
jgi:hypothetical protein